MAQEIATAHGVVVVNGVRTAIGMFGSSLKDVAPCELGALVVYEALARAGMEGGDVGHVVFGRVINTESRDIYPSYMAAVNGGVSVETPAFNVNRLYDSSLQAVVNAAQTVLLGDADIVIADGAESISRTPYLAPVTCWDSRMGDTKMVDMVFGALHDPFRTIHMGVAVENVACKSGIGRKQQNQTTLESHQRASRAIQASYFKDQVVPVTIRSRKDDIQFDTNRHVHHDVTIDNMTKLKPVLTKENDTVTAGNASGFNDADAALVLIERSAAKKHGPKPLARLMSYDHVGVDPETMGTGPVPATRKALKRTGLSVKDLDVIETNEVFAAQACAVTKELNLDPVKINPNGSDISFGHPIGATGALITVKALRELQRVGGYYALVVMYIDGGQGITAVFKHI